MNTSVASTEFKVPSYKNNVYVLKLMKVQSCSPAIGLYVIAPTCGPNSTVKRSSGTGFEGVCGDAAVFLLPSLSQLLAKVQSLVF